MRRAQLMGYPMVASIQLLMPSLLGWRRGTLMHPFCHLVLRAIRVVPPPWINDLTTLSEALRKYRMQANLSQKTLAAKLGVTVGTLGTWERGQATPGRQSWLGLRALLTVL